MSHKSKYHIGDRLKRHPGSGFIAGGNPEFVVIPDVPENHSSPCPCLVCDDPACVEWPTIWADDGSATLYHVSECELSPVLLEPSVPMAGAES